VKTDLVAVVLLRSFSERLEVEVSEPDLDQVSEAALRNENPGAAERGAVQQSFFEEEPCLGCRPCGHPDVPHTTIRDANPCLGGRSFAPAAYGDRAIGAESARRAASLSASSSYTKSVAETPRSKMVASTTRGTP